MAEITKISLFSIDSLRYDCVGYQPDKKFLKKDSVIEFLDTPTIDSISNQSLCFTKCYSTSSITTPAIASMFTGTKQINHGIRLHVDSTKVTMHEKTVTLAEILKKNGFVTVISLDSAAHLKIPQITRGFDHEFVQNDKKLFSFLENHENEKIFLFCDFEDVHVPYLYSVAPPSKEYNDDFFQTMKQLYEQNGLKSPKRPFHIWNNLFKANPDRKIWFPLYVKGVSKFDKGRFKIFMERFEKMGFVNNDNSLLIITADHGQGRHNAKKPNSFGHGGEAFEEIVRVPLIVNGPGISNGKNDNLVSNIDIFRLILDSCIKQNISDFIKYKIYSINPIYKKREFAWFVFSERSFHDDPLQYHPVSRTIMSNNKKFRLWGKPETFLDKKTFELSNKEFMIKLYDDLFARPSHDIEIERNVTKLEDGSLTKQQVYEKFLKLPEYAKKNAFTVIDLDNDPFEENPINPTYNVGLLLEYGKHLQYMVDLEVPEEPFLEQKKESATEDSDSEKTKEEELRAELKKLGYI